MIDQKIAAELKVEFDNIIKEPPFNGQVTHRTRPIFLAKWKELLEKKKITSPSYVDDLLKLMGK